MTLNEGSTSEDTPRDAREEFRTRVLELQRLAIETLDMMAQQPTSERSCYDGSCNGVAEVLEGSPDR
jgi:hypothetical protein